MRSRRDTAGRPWHLYLLALLAAGVAAFAITQIGPPTSSARTSRELITAEDGVVQSTVSGTGNVEAGTDVDVNFQTSGTLSQVLVSVGQHVNQGQLLATLDPTSAQLALDQAQESLTAAEDQLSQLESGTSSSTTSASTTVSSSTQEFVSLKATRRPAKTKKKPTAKRPTRPTTTGRAPTRTSTTPTTTTTTTTPATSSGSTRSGSGGTGGTSTTSTTPTPSSIASAEASIDSAQQTVDNAEQALAHTNLYAPASGTIVSLAALSPGDTVSAGSTGTASSSAGSSTSSGTSSGGGGGAAGGSTTAGGLGGGGGTSSSSSGGTGSSSSTPFAEIVDASTMTMTVAFSESDITKVHVGQPATVSIDALSGVELAAHVSSISPVGSTSSGVVSYDATLTLDQTDPSVKPGMSASATVIVSQAEGVNVPAQAVTGTGSLATVNLNENGKTVSQPVIVGLRGDSRDLIVSGLNAGQQVVVTVTLPALGTSATSTTGATGTLGGAGGVRLGGFGGGGFAGGGAFRGGGGFAGGG